MLSLAAAAVALAASAAVAAWSFPLRSLTPGDEPAGGGATKAPPRRGPERKIVSKVNPVYPPEAKRDKVEGIVLLDVTVEKSGEVSKVSVVKGPEALRDASVAAVRQWRYEPSDVGPVLMTITVRFMLDKSKDKDSGRP